MIGLFRRAMVDFRNCYECAVSTCCPQLQMDSMRKEVKFYRDQLRSGQLSAVASCRSNRPFEHLFIQSVKSGTYLAQVNKLHFFVNDIKGKRCACLWLVRLLFLEEFGWSSWKQLQGQGEFIHTRLAMATIPWHVPLAACGASHCQALGRPLPRSEASCRAGAHQTLKEFQFRVLIHFDSFWFILIQVLVFNSACLSSLQIVPFVHVTKHPIRNWKELQLSSNMLFVFQQILCTFEGMKRWAWLKDIESFSIIFRCWKPLNNTLGCVW